MDYAKTTQREIKTTTFTKNPWVVHFWFLSFTFPCFVAILFGEDLKKDKKSLSFFFFQRLFLGGNQIRNPKS